jgi:hypothetical protein
MPKDTTPVCYATDSAPRRIGSAPPEIGSASHRIDLASRQTDLVIFQTDPPRRYTHPAAGQIEYLARSTGSSSSHSGSASIFAA